jgi:hypothetical protein
MVLAATARATLGRVAGDEVAAFASAGRARVPKVEAALLVVLVFALRFGVAPVEPTKRDGGETAGDETKATPRPSIET